MKVHVVTWIVFLATLVTSCGPFRSREDLIIGAWEQVEAGCPVRIEFAKPNKFREIFRTYDYNTQQCKAPTATEIFDYTYRITESGDLMINKPPAPNFRGGEEINEIAQLDEDHIAYSIRTNTFHQTNGNPAYFRRLK
jgi:hypothetical protein